MFDEVNKLQAQQMQKCAANYNDHENWQKQKQITKNATLHCKLNIGCSTIYLCLP